MTSKDEATGTPAQTDRKAAWLRKRVLIWVLKIFFPNSGTLLFKHTGWVNFRNPREEQQEKIEEAFLNFPSLKRYFGKKSFLPTPIPE